MRQQARLWLAASAVVFGPMRAEKLGIELDSLRGEQVPDEVLRLRERAPGERGRAQPILVADEHQPVARSLQFEQRRNHARQQANLLQAVDLLIGRLLDERAVAIDEQDACAAHGRCHRGQQPLVLLRRADRDAQAICEGRCRAEIAHEKAGCLAGLEKLLRLAAFDEQEVGVRRVDASHGLALCETGTHFAAFREQRPDSCRGHCPLRRLGQRKHFLHGRRGDRIRRNDALQQPDDFVAGQQRAEARAGQRVGFRQACAGSRDSGIPRDAATRLAPPENSIYASSRTTTAVPANASADGQHVRDVQQVAGRIVGRAQEHELRRASGCNHGVHVELKSSPTSGTSRTMAPWIRAATL